MVTKRIRSIKINAKSYVLAKIQMVTKRIQFGYDLEHGYVLAKIQMVTKLKFPLKPLFLVMF